MVLSESQKTGIKLFLISFLSLVALLWAYDVYDGGLGYLLVLILGLPLAAMTLWSLAMATTSPDSNESVEFNFRRYLAASRGVAVRSEKEIEEAEQMETAIDLDDQERIDKL